MKEDLLDIVQSYLDGMSGLKRMYETDIDDVLKEDDVKEKVIDSYNKLAQVKVILKSLYM